ncbi:mediator of RNA polymerase II transcription subunit 25-like [Aristolochia californica]|uniref:mediator of RNA polymerase II transcription subunit 25-like n=1 Tax=Aristolochia californica TaxID=171875 RepID=UPI0035DA8579
MADRQLIVVVEGTAAVGPFWQSIVADYLDRIIRCFCGNEVAGQKHFGANFELSLVVFNAHGPYSAFLVQRSGWTKDMDIFFHWLSCIPFIGGGFGEVAIAEGLAEALMSQQSTDAQKHCILVAASNPFTLPTPACLPPAQNLEQKESPDVQRESSLSDAETVAKSFAQFFVSLSIISPKQIPKLRAIYTAGKRNPRATDPAIDNVRHPQFLILLSENFIEGRAALSRNGMANLTSNPSPVKMDQTGAPPISGSPPTSISSVNGPMANRQPVSVGNTPTATVKVEPVTVSSVVPGPVFSHLPAQGTALGVPNFQTFSPSPTSQEMVTVGDNFQYYRPLVSSIPQPIRPSGPAAANVSILNNPQVRQVISSASLTGASSIGLPTMGNTSMAVHMSNMISSGMTTSALPTQSVFSTGHAGSGGLVGTSQVTQNTTLGSFTSSASNVSGNSNLGMPASLANNVQGVGMAQAIPAMSRPVPGMGQSVPGIGQSVPGIMSQGNLTSLQIGQSGLGMNQNMMSGLGSSGISSASGTMIPTPGMSHQDTTGMQPLNVSNGSAANMPLPQHPPGTLQSQSKYLKVWEGALSGQRQGQPVFICRLEGYRNATASETLATDWPATMHIVRLISQDLMNNKQYVGKADFLVFRALNQHWFLGQLQEKKLFAVIQLPSQTLLLSVSDKASRLIGMLFPGDMVVFKPQLSSQQQLQHQQQQQQLQQQAQQQQQMVGAGMSQSFVQGGSSNCFSGAYRLF